MRLCIATLAGVASVLVASSASALGTPPSEHPYRSAQNFALELRFGPYYPDVDSEPALEAAGARPFEQSFGTKDRLLIGIEFDWQIFRIPRVGTIGAGIGVGYSTMSRDATTTSGRPSGDSMSLEVFPLTAVAVLRADTFWRDYGFPFVPYGKVGVGYALWRASNTGGTASFERTNADGTTSAVKGRGGSLGTNLGAGVMFALDVFDRGASRNMDNATGINGTYLFAEYYWMNLTGFGSDSTLRVGTNTWTAGLAFEF